MHLIWGHFIFSECELAIPIPTPHTSPFHVGPRVGQMEVVCELLGVVSV